MQRRSILILSLGLMLFVCFPSTIPAQPENFGPIKFARPGGFDRRQTDNAIIFSRVDRSRQRFCFITLYAAAPSSPSPKKGFEKEWAEKVVRPWGAAANTETETEIVNRLTWVSGDGDVYIDGNKATAILSVASAHGKSASLLGIFNHPSCMTNYKTFAEELEIEK